MILTQAQIDRLLKGKPVQSRVLVKKNEVWDRTETAVWIESKGKGFPLRKKWQVGRDYAVQLGRGKSGLWYCPICKRLVKKIPTDDDTDYFYECSCIVCSCL